MAALTASICLPVRAAAAPARKATRCAPVAASRSAFAGVALPVRAVRPRKVVARAAKAESQSFDTEEVIKTLQEKWEQTENKSSIALYAGGAAAAIWLSATVVGVVNAIPLLPKIMELVGLGYSSWFVYRYLLFKESRKELVADVEELKAKISGKSD